MQQKAIIAMEKILKFIGMAIGGGFGWFVAEFHPSFPLIIIAAIFIFSDAYTAYRLDRRVHIKYPDKTSRKLAKFTSFAFSKTPCRMRKSRIRGRLSSV